MRKRWGGLGVVAGFGCFDMWVCIEVYTFSDGGGRFVCGQRLKHKLFGHSNNIVTHMLRYGEYAAGCVLWYKIS